MKNLKGCRGFSLLELIFTIVLLGIISTSIPFMQNINRHKVMHIDKLGIYKLVNAQPEIVVVHHSPKINADRMLRFLKPKLLIMDGSNYPSVTKAFKKSAKRFKVRFYNTAKQGTFTLK